VIIRRVAVGTFASDCQYTTQFGCSVGTFVPNSSRSVVDDPLLQPNQKYVRLIQCFISTVSSALFHQHCFTVLRRLYSGSFGIAMAAADSLSEHLYNLSGQFLVRFPAGSQPGRLATRYALNRV